MQKHHNLVLCKHVAQFPTPTVLSFGEIKVYEGFLHIILRIPKLSYKNGLEFSSYLISFVSFS